MRFKKLYSEPDAPVVSKPGRDSQNISVRLPGHMIGAYRDLINEGVRPTDFATASLKLMFRLLDNASEGCSVPVEVEYVHGLRKQRVAAKQRLVNEISKKRDEIIEMENALKELDERVGG